MVTVERCMTSKASRALGAPVQAACIAAHEGTATGLATSEGLGEGKGLGGGLGVGLASSDGVGLVLRAVPVEPQAVSANSTDKATTPTLTVD
jgi:hypothetical protein